MSLSSSPRVLDLLAGAVVGLVTIGAGAWVAATGAGVPEEALTSVIGGWTDDGGVLILPGWVRIALGLGIVVPGLVIGLGVAKETAHRRGERQSATSVSERQRSIVVLVLSVWVGAFFSLIGGILVLVSAGVITTLGGGEPEMPWFFGAIGAVVALAAWLVSYSSVYQWFGGTGLGPRRRPR